MQVTVRTREPIDVVFMRHTGPYDQVGATWDRLAAWAGPRGLFGPATQFIGISYDDPRITESSNVRYDACIRVASPPVPEGEVGVRRIAGGEFAMAIHEGLYDRLGESYDIMIGGWLTESGRDLADRPALEIDLPVRPQKSRTPKAEDHLAPAGSSGRVRLRWGTDERERVVGAALTVEIRMFHPDGHALAAALSHSGLLT
jgi:DNA gyrase inhibitor GyrI